MSEQVFEAAASVTPAWLTATLRREGVLTRGAVVAVEIVDHARLCLTYSEEASPSVPQSLYLKFGRLDHPDGPIGLREAAAYRTLSPLRDVLPMVLRCYDVASDPVTGASHLLLADFSATHALPTLPTPLPYEREAITDCTAAFHAYWWQCPRREQFDVVDPNIGLDCTDADAYAAYAAWCQDAYPYFADYLGDRLATDERALYERLLAALPSFWPRYLAPRFRDWDAITLVQGDSHWGQFACPRRPGSGQTSMIDLECLHWGLPAADLAYRIPPDWTPAGRRALEPAIIARYVDRLQQGGVVGYDKERFWHDYRLSTIFLTLYPLKWFTAQFADRVDPQRVAGRLPAWWGGILEMLLLNYDDMNCVDLCR